MRLRVQYNAPVVLTFAFLALAALVAGNLTGGWTTTRFFSVCRASFTDPLTYFRLVGHVLGHANYSHYMGNMMLLLVVGSILLTRNLKVDHISKRQAALEALYSLGKNFFEGLLGKEGSRYVPYLMTVALYIACSNVIGVFGVKPPTKDLDVTAALALMSIVLIEYAGVRARGGAGFLKSLAAPTPIMTPMNILEIAIRPTSLCMRLFGNVLGAFVIMELLKLVVPVFVPAVFSLYFDLFDGLIQTYVFVFLTALFMKESIGGEE